MITRRTELKELRIRWRNELVEGMNSLNYELIKQGSGVRVRQTWPQSPTWGVGWVSVGYFRVRWGHSLTSSLFDKFKIWQVGSSTSSVWWVRCLMNSDSTTSHSTVLLFSLHFRWSNQVHVWIPDCRGGIIDIKYIDCTSLPTLWERFAP